MITWNKNPFRNRVTRRVLQSILFFTVTRSPGRSFVDLVFLFLGTLVTWLQCNETRHSIHISSTFYITDSEKTDPGSHTNNTVSQPNLPIQSSHTELDGFTHYSHLSIILDRHSFFRLPSRLLQKKKWKKKIVWVWHSHVKITHEKKFRVKLLFIMNRWSES